MTVTAIEPQKKRPDRFSVYADGAFLFGISGEGLTRLNLSVGDEITREELTRLRARAYTLRALEAARRYMGYRPRTVWEVRRKLAEAGYPDAVADRVIAHLTKRGDLNDLRYAVEYVNARCRPGGYGPYRARRDLRVRGVDGAVIDRVLAARREGADVRSIRALLERKRVNLSELDFAERRRLTGMLARRGFPFDAIRAALTEEMERVD